MLTDKIHIESSNITLSEKSVEELINYLLPFLTEERICTMNNVLGNRMRYLSVVLEDIYQPQNASAVLRSCDCFGVQDVHIIENENTYEINPDVVQGASKWLTIYKYNKKKNNTLDAISALKQKGYRIVATSPHSKDCLLEDFDIAQQKTALIFGTELTGVSQQVIDHADAFVRIPMYGFTESFNISVSAALAMHHLTGKLRASTAPWQLMQKEKKLLYLEWITKSIKLSDELIRRFCKEQNLSV